MCIAARSNATNPDAARKNTALPAAIFAKVIDGDFLMPGTATMRLSLRRPNELQGRKCPITTYDLKGIKCRVPTGYTRDTPAGGYADTWPGTWAGTWKGTNEWTDNPGFILLDILTADYGLGLVDAESRYAQSIRGGQVLLAIWSTMASTRARTDALRSITFSRPERTALKVAMIIASAMHAQLWWAGGKIFVTQDRPDRSRPALIQPDERRGRTIFQYEGIARSGPPVARKSRMARPGPQLPSRPSNPSSTYRPRTDTVDASRTSLRSA